MEGVVRAPSEFSITRTLSPSMMATAELVVPRSIPMILDIVLFPLDSLLGRIPFPRQPTSEGFDRDLKLLRVGQRTLFWGVPAAPYPLYGDAPRKFNGASEKFCVDEVSSLEPRSPWPDEARVRESSSRAERPEQRHPRSCLRRQAPWQWPAACWDQTWRPSDR
jgi:hypothetical protein